MATVKELASRIGAETLVTFERGAVVVRCKIVDARTAYGRAQLQVEPVGGEGSVWVEEGRLRKDRTPDTICDSFHDGLGCTRYAGHEGEHQADGPQGEAYARWPQEVLVPNPL